VLLALTLFHALRLERALGVLKRDRAALAELVQGFNDATSQAEAGIDRLRGAADGAGRQIARHVESAVALKDDLIFLTERGEKLADRMDGLVRAARGMTDRMPEPARAAPSFAASPAAAPAPVAPALADPAEEEPRVRSQAERDLLKALRMAR
jgi:hypothetical protein